MRVVLFVLAVLLVSTSQAAAARGRGAHVLVKRAAATTAIPPVPCTSGTCLNGGVCTPFGNLAVCVCPPGYGGLFCQLLLSPGLTNPSAVTITAAPSINNLCLPNPCQNGGLCLPVSPNLATCACPKNFNGIYCQLLNGVLFVNTTASLPSIGGGTTAASSNVNIPLVSISPFAVCFPGACLNGGTCLTINNLGLCMCLPNFSGSRCEFPQNNVTLPPGFFNGATTTPSSGTLLACPASNNPCQNGGSCVLINNTPTCFCTAGFFPPVCSSTPGSTTTGAIGNCNPNPCLNNQPCLFLQNQPVCFCGAGFLPPLCTASGATTPAGTTVSVGPCSAPDPCNGQPCLVVNGATQCFCQNGSTQSNCAPAG